ncbi:MAG: carbon monoxide dehydrogenase subunit G [Pseudomonadota bacterium]
MNYKGSQSLPHPIELVWQALLDPVVLQQCIAGCEKFERTGEDEYKSTVKISIGPVSARFASTVTLTDVVAPVSCTLKFAGQGGVAGFGKGEAHVRLSPEEGGTKLDWDADASVGGKLAQIGSRLIEATVRKMSDDFFVRFANQLQVQNPSAGDAATPAETTATPAATAPGSSMTPVIRTIAVMAIVAIAVALGWWFAR